MKIAILGAGAMGGLFGAYLSKEHEVLLVDTNSSLVEAINTNGMRVREPDNRILAYYPKASTSTRGMEPVDLVIVFVKSAYTEIALRENAGLIGPGTDLLTLQNGSGHEDTLSRFADQSRIILGTTQHNASLSQAGITHHGGSGVTYLGYAKGEAGRLQPIADTFTACGLETYVSGDVQKMIWNKMFTNVSASALTGALQVPLGGIVQNPSAWEMCCRLVREAVDVAQGMGMDFDYDKILRQVKEVCEKSPQGLTSIYSDLKNGRITEVDAISGSVVRAGEKCGVAAPSHSFLVHFIHAMEEKSLS